MIAISKVAHHLACADEEPMLPQRGPEGKVVSCTISEAVASKVPNTRVPDSSCASLRNSFKWVYV